MTRYFRMLVALVVALMAMVGDLRDAEAQEHAIAETGAWAAGGRTGDEYAVAFGDSAEAAVRALRARGGVTTRMLVCIVAFS